MNALRDRLELALLCGVMAFLIVVYISMFTVNNLEFAL